MAAVLPRLEARHWVYLDEARSHEVHAQAATAGGASYLVTTEFPMGSREPTEVVQAQTPVRGEEELVTLLRELEDRLALGGRYFRTDVNAREWTPLAPPSRAVDLRAREAPIPGMESTGAKMRFHHFHGENGDQDRLLISMPRPGMSGRHVLAEMRFDFPRVDEGALHVLHARLAAPLLSSAVAKEHVEAPRRGFAKLFEPRDYERAYGNGWLDKTKTMFRSAASRLVAPSAPETPRVPHAVPSDLDTIQRALGSSRAEALRSRYVDPVTEALLVEGGEHAIRRHVNGLRKRASHAQIYDLAMVEAILLLEYAIPAKMWDLASEEGGKLLRFVGRT